jgi:hypothetical protein
VGRTDVEFTDQFAEWYGTLDVSQQEDVQVYVGLLEEKGVTLDHPHSTAIKGSKYSAFSRAGIRFAYSTSLIRAERPCF